MKIAIAMILSFALVSIFGNFFFIEKTPRLRPDIGRRAQHLTWRILGSAHSPWLLHSFEDAKSTEDIRSQTVSTPLAPSNPSIKLSNDTQTGQQTLQIKKGSQLDKYQFTLPDGSHPNVYVVIP